MLIRYLNSYDCTYPLYIVDDFMVGPTMELYLKFDLYRIPVYSGFA